MAERTTRGGSVREGGRAAGQGGPATECWGSRAPGKGPPRDREGAAANWDMGALGQGRAGAGASAGAVRITGVSDPRVRGGE